jgi:Ca2+-binding RTX toxin-like protein
LDQIRIGKNSGELYVSANGVDYEAGPGNDSITSITGASGKQYTLTLAGSGNNTVTAANNKNNIIWGEAGIDIIGITGDGKNTVVGGTGDDTITITGTGNNTVYTSELSPSTEAAAITAERAEENSVTITSGGKGDNKVYGSLGKDIINITSNGKNVVEGRGGIDTITINGNGANEVYAGSGNDTIIINGNGDNIVSLSDEIGTSESNTVTITGTGKNTVYGSDGVDTITGGSGNDHLYGYGGNDVIRGGAGKDIINGGAGNDHLYGDAGSDEYVFDANHGRDVIHADDDGANVIKIVKARFSNYSVEQVSGGIMLYHLLGKNTIFIENGTVLDNIQFLGDTGARPLGSSGGGDSLDNLLQLWETHGSDKYEYKEGDNVSVDVPVSGKHYYGDISSLHFEWYSGPVYKYYDAQTNSSVYVSEGGDILARVYGYGAAPNPSVTVGEDRDESAPIEQTWDEMFDRVGDKGELVGGNYITLDENSGPQGCESSVASAQDAPVAQKDPLILDLDGNGFGLKAADGSARFDLAGNGFATSNDWIHDGDGLLVRDLNGNGVIDNINELFGSPAMMGFDELAAFDSNGDGKIDANDEIWASLRVWVDDGDATTQAGELKTLAELGIASISLTRSAANIGVENSTIVETATFTRTNGTTGLIGEAMLYTDTVDSRYIGDPADFRLWA